MPYRIVQDGEQWCLEQSDTGEKVKGSCHADKDVTERMLGAIRANEEQDADHDKARRLRENEPPRDEEDSEQMEALGEDADADDDKPAEKALFERIWTRISERLGSKDAADDGTGFKVHGNHWIAVWSNNFRDREGELFTTKAIDDYVARVNMGLVPPPELWDSHIPGTKSGEAEFVWRQGHFLMAFGSFDDTPKGRAAKAYYAKRAKQQGISHGYRFPTKHFDGADYHAFNTFEISPLPRGAEANRFTSLEGIKEMALNDKQKKRLFEVFGKDEAEKILSEQDEKGKLLEALNVEFKEFAQTDTGADGAASDEGSDLALALKELLPDLMEGQSEAVKAATEAVKAIKAFDERLKQVEAWMKETPKRASKSPLTELDEDDEDDAKFLDGLNHEERNEKIAKAFPGFYDKNADIRKYVPNSTIR